MGDEMLTYGPAKTGFYVRRITDDGHVRNLDVAEMSDDQLKDFFGGCSEKEAISWATALAGWIRDNVVQLEVEDGD